MDVKSACNTPPGKPGQLHRLCLAAYDATRMSCNELIVHRPEGLYCPPGDFYIDPWRPVERAVITHAHSDHARMGSAHYLAHHDSAGTLRNRLGADIALSWCAR